MGGTVLFTLLEKSTFVVRRCVWGNCLIYTHGI